MTPPLALTIAGSDSSGGAGIQADLKTFSALGVYGASVITAITAQNTLGVSAVHDVPPEMVLEQMRAVLSDLDVRVIKIGMLSSAAIIKAVVSELETYQGFVVVDPVMIAASGDALLRNDAVEVLRARLLPRADLLTPNLPEASALLGSSQALNIEEQIQQAAALQQLGARAVLVKGGHGQGTESTDVLLDADGFVSVFRKPRLATRHTHGTGCTLSSAIAAQLAHGQSLTEAVSSAKDYVFEAIAAADALRIGKGSGPVHHFYRWW